ncbi:MAG: hypothetical protein AAGK21_12350, partial [Bacteroidota bacterium]
MLAFPPALLLLAWGVLLAMPARAQTASPVPAPTDQAVTAVYVEEAPRLDGRLDEAFWDDIEPVTSFTQVFPEIGADATEATEVRIAY